MLKNIRTTSSKKETKRERNKEINNGQQQYRDMKCWFLLKNHKISDLS